METGDINSSQPAEAMIKLSVIIPVFNEEESLDVFLPILDVILKFPHEILVVYDSEQDLSVPVVQKHAEKSEHIRGVLNTKGRGVSKAWQSGISAASGEYLLVMVADEIGPIMAVESFVSLLDQGCDYVSGTRYANGGRRFGGSHTGSLLSRTANRMFQYFAGCVLTDATTGMKAFKRNVAKQLQFSEDSVGWEVAFETAIQAQALGLKLGEVPLVSIDRQFGGQSTFKLVSWTKGYGKRFINGRRILKNSNHRMKKSDVMIARDRFMM